MTFTHLEDALQEGQIESYLELFNHLQEPTRTVLGYTLDVASFLNLRGLREEYSVFGGYAVLSHLMHTYGPGIAKIWRGSTDIDMAGTKKVLTALKSGYDFHSDSKSSNVPDKRTLKLELNGETECKIDFSEGDFFEKYGVPRQNIHFGVPLMVVDPERLIRGKLLTPLSESQHAGDILGMLSVLEKIGQTPEQISTFFLGQDRSRLLQRLDYAEEEFQRDRLGFFPSEDFLRELKKNLSKRIVH